MQTTRELDLAAVIEPHMAANQCTAGSPGADEPNLPPRDIVRALNEIAALQKERAALKAHVGSPPLMGSISDFGHAYNCHLLSMHH